MKEAMTVLGIAAALAVTPIGFAQGQQQKSAKNVAVAIAADKATFQEVRPGVSMATLWGTPDRGRYGAFTRFMPGFDAGMHTHTNDTWLVVLKGAYLYRDDAGDKRIAAGEFIRIPGKHKHWSGGDPTEGALFYQESSGKFDLVPEKERLPLP